MPSPMIEAIAAHRAAWQAFQDAPLNSKNTKLNIAAHRAELVMHSACDVLFSVVPTSVPDLLALADHVDWYCDEEKYQADDRMLSLQSVICFAMEAGRTQVAEPRGEAS